MMKRITRRDFINGMLRTVAASMILPDWVLAGDDPPSYPPALQGMRGSHNGSFEVAHQLKDGTLWEKLGKAEEANDIYDLIVVGAGISGLSAAWYFRKATNPKTRILILDNHDDFGGHARRQEFGKDKNFTLTFGGSFAIESAAPYSPNAKALIQELGIDVPAFRKYVQRTLYRSHALYPGFFFDQKTFGSDRLLPDPYTDHYTEPSEIKQDAWGLFLKEAPLSEKAKKDLLRLHNEKVDYMPGLTQVEKKSKLSTVSYAEFLTTIAQCDPGVLTFFDARAHSLYGAGIDAIPAQDAWGLGFAGFGGMDLGAEPGIGMNHDAIYSEEAGDYFFHFPDGNATIARLLVRKLIPEAMPGNDAEDIVLARANYRKLDSSKSPARIRLNSTVVKVAHRNRDEVEVHYVQQGKARIVRTKRCVLACWHTVIPYICPELSNEQKTALAYAIKVPLMYARVAVRNWIPWVKLGIHHVYAPGCYFPSLNLPIPLSIGGYKTASKPEKPTVICLTKAFCRPGLPIRHQHRLGRQEVLTTSFELFEKRIREQLDAILAPGGFDSSRDITGIALHRWPHGYAYQYNSLYDPFWLEGKEGPCATARKPFGRIAIANSDAAAYSYADAAIDQAHRAVKELLGV